MIDLHIHGCFGYSFHRGDPNHNITIANRLRDKGIDWILATLVALPYHRLRNALNAIRIAMEKTEVIRGAYIEGPFINRERLGGIPKEYVESWQMEDFKRVIEEYKEVIKIVTVAPELKEADYILKFLKDREIKVAIGHSLATYEETMRFIEKGADLATHIYNAMRGFHHREPGIVGAILESNIPCEIITEKHHLHPAVVKLTYRIKGKDSVIPVSDATSLAEDTKEERMFGGRRVIRREGACFTEDGTLYGSAILLPEGLDYLVKLGVYENIEDAVSSLKRAIEKVKIV